MKSKLKSLLALLLTVIMGFPTIMFLSSCSKKDDADTFTIWLSPHQGISQHYTDLSLNPVMKYVGNKFGITLKFEVPPGAASEQFTLLTSSGDFPEVMELSSYNGAVIDLVEDGVAVDLTEYIMPSNGGKSMFPNYQTLIKDDEISTAVRTFDKKYLSLFTMDDELNDPWGGYVYRKDIVFKYRNRAESFVLDGKTINPALWTNSDDIVFPSGAKAPDLISDYDWMFKIMKYAVDANELNYCMSLYFPGYVETGDFVSAWGVSGLWYTVEGADGKKTVEFGGDSEKFKDYINKIKEWYAAGYIDKDFSSRTGDQFFSIDSASFVSGKIGCMYGSTGFLGNKLAGRNGSPEDLDMRAAYMPRMTKNDSPAMFYSGSRLNRNWMITTKALNKNYEKLFNAMDYLYGEEGSLMLAAGLNKEQYAELNVAGINTALGDWTFALTDEERAIMGVSTNTVKISDVGSYYWSEKEKSNVYFADLETNVANDNVYLAVSGISFFGCTAVTKIKEVFQHEAEKEARGDIWKKYKATGAIDTSITSKLTSEQSNSYFINYNAIRDYMSMEVPKFIKGTRTFDDSNWKNFSNNLKLKGCNTNKQYLQSVYDILSQN